MTGDTLGIITCLFLLYYVLRKDIHDIKPKPKSKPSKPKEPIDEHVYIIYNPSFKPGIFKIGLTTRDVDTRLAELRTTGVPSSFVKCIVLKTHDCKRLEKHLHDKYRIERMDSRREFFKLDIHDIANIVHDHREEAVMINHDALGRALNRHPSEFKAMM